MIRALIIDDEENSRVALSNLLEKHCLDIEVLGMGDSAKAGLELIKKHYPDIVFLDIEMPKGTGFDMLDQIENIDFDVIFTTAYDQYAIKAIKFCALDYLLKPIDVDELIEAVNRVDKKIAKQNKGKKFELFVQYMKDIKTTMNQIALPTSDGLNFVEVNEIIRCEASEYYTYTFMNNETKILVSKTLKDFDELLTDYNFFRVHQSHLINLNYIRKYIRDSGGVIVMDDGIEIPVSRRKKEGFLKIWNKP